MAKAMNAARCNPIKKRMFSFIYASFLHPFYATPLFKGNGVLWNAFSIQVTAPQALYPTNSLSRKATRGCRPVNFLTFEEIRKISSTPKRLKAEVIIRILLNTGIRSGELKTLDVQDVDYTAKQLYIIDSKKHERKAVPVDTKTLDLIQRYAHSRSEGPLIISQVTKGRMTRAAIQKTVRKAAEKAGIHKKVSPRTLRHTFAITWLRHGGDIETLRRILRHTTLLSTQKYLDFEQARVLREYQRIFNHHLVRPLVPERKRAKPDYLV